MSESQLVNQIYKHYYNSNIFLWRANCGKFRIGKRYIQANVNGTPDLIGFDDKGIFTGIEAKFGKGKQEDSQLWFEAMCLKQRATYILAYSLQDVIDILGEPVRG